MNRIDIISEFVFLAWCVLRLTFNVGSGNAGWSAAFGAITLLTALLVASKLFP